MKRVVCVEDDASIRELIVYTLEMTGYEAVGYADGKEFREALQKEGDAGSLPDLILLDVMLPDENGVTILRRLKEKDLTGKIPVIMLTARNSEFDKVTALDLGADDYVTKPFGMMELMSRIRAVLGFVSKGLVFDTFTAGFWLTFAAFILSLGAVQDHGSNRLAASAFGLTFLGVIITVFLGTGTV